MNKRKIYWILQIGGWSLYGFLQIFLYSTAQQLYFNHVLGEILQVLFYILSTHLLRYVFIRFDWLTYHWVKLIPQVLITLLAFSIINYGFLLFYSFLTDELTSRDFLPFTVTLNVVGPMIMYFIWTMFYFTFHYVDRYNKSLKLEAAAKEIELRNLRSQLNPHFIFNALNSIRALVDENPPKSKIAITQLSNILRNSLNVDRQRLVTFSEELEMVRDYLALETIRYEERLKTNFEVDPKSTEYLIPPLMVQTLVENAIKHGISTLKDGGLVEVISRVNEDNITIQIRNAGQYMPAKNKKKSGFGLENTQKRLELIYGEQATFRIFNDSKKTVLTEIVIPRSL